MIKVNEDGKNVYLGLGFEDRSDSFDLNSTLHDYFKGLLVSRNINNFPADFRFLIQGGGEARAGERGPS